MEHPELPRCWTTERLKLRPFTLTDVPEVLAYASDVEWGRFLPVPIPYRRQDAEAFVALQLGADHCSDPVWAIEHAGVGVGSIALALNHELGVATLHYSIAHKLWGQGFMTETVRGVVDLAFQGLGHLERIAATADALNIGSWRVMEKAGLVREGIFRSSAINRGARVDEVFHAVLRTDWAARRGGAART